MLVILKFNLDINFHHTQNCFISFNNKLVALFITTTKFSCIIYPLHTHPSKNSIKHLIPHIYLSSSVGKIPQCPKAVLDKTAARIT